MDDTGGLGTPSDTPTTASGSAFNVGPYMTLAGGITSAYAQYQSGRYNQKIARYNASLKRIQAEQAIQAGNERRNVIDARERIVEGGTRANFAAQGVVVGAGTSMAVIDSERSTAEMDKLLVSINANRQAFGFQTAARGDDLSGDMAMRTGRMGAISTALNTGAQLELESDPKYRGYHGSGVTF